LGTDDGPDPEPPRFERKAHGAAQVRRVGEPEPGKAELHRPAHECLRRHGAIAEGEGGVGAELDHRGISMTAYFQTPWTSQTSRSASRQSWTISPSARTQQYASQA